LTSLIFGGIFYPTVKLSKEQKMFDLNVGDVCHKSFNGDSYPYIVHETAICRGRKVCDLFAIPTLIDNIQIIPSYDMYKGESANSLLLPNLEILGMLREKYKEDCSGIIIYNFHETIVQSFKKEYWHPVGDTKPAFRWYEGMRCSRNPSF